MSRDSTTELQIVGAVYGLAKVTDIVIGLVNRQTTPQSLTVQASNAVFGDSWSHHPKSLTIVYRYGDTGLPQTIAATEGNTLTIGPSQFEAATTSDMIMTSPLLTVWGASYGPTDVSSKVRNMISPTTQSLSLTANDATFGDTWGGVLKTFVIVASYENQVPFVDIVVENNPYALKFRPPLQILSAFWGLTDVKRIVQTSVTQRMLSLTASDAIFGDGWPGKVKTLDVVYQYSDRTPKLVIAAEGDTLAVDFDSSLPAYRPPVDPRTLNIIAAAYGIGDVTSIVASLISNQTLKFTADDATLGDPWVGHDKSFALTYSWGPAAISNFVVQEGESVSVAEPIVEWNKSFISLVGLFADGDLLKVQTGTGQYWAVGNGGQITVTATSISDAEQFTIGVATAGTSEITLRASDGSYVVVGVDGTLHTGGTAQQAAGINPSALSSGSIVLCLSGGVGAPFMNVNESGAIVANGSYTSDFSSAFNFLLVATTAGFENHVMAYTGLRSTDLPADDTLDPLLLNVIWDLTGGFFLAVGLGPLINQGVPRAGLLALLQSNPRVNAAIERAMLAVRNNPERSWTGLFIGLEAVIWDERLMWPILRYVFNKSVWWLGAYVVAKILEVTFAPSLEAAELAVSFAIWTYQTTRDILAYANSGGKTDLLGGASVAAAD